MRVRETHINVRTTPEEKARFERNAKRCGLSLSEYLRKLANGHEPKALPPFQYSELVAALSELYSEFQRCGNKSAEGKILQLVTQLTVAISPGGRSDNGDHKNLAGS